MDGRSLFGICNRRLATPLIVENELVCGARPRIHASRRHHSFERLNIRTSVIASLAHESWRIGRPERTLEILGARTPQVILGKLRLAGHDIRRPPRGGRDIWRERIKIPEDARQHLAADAVTGGIGGILPPVARDRTILLVVRAPQRKTWVRPQAHDLNLSLLLYRLCEIVVLLRLHIAHHEILPNKNTVSVTEIVKRIRFIHTSAPDADHVAVQVNQHV